MKCLPCGLLLLLLAGCTGTVTNLTPSQLTRNPTGLYPFSAAWDSRQRSLCQDTIKAYVVIGLESYPMQPTPLVKNRWEGLVPVAATNELVHYRYKFDFEYLSIPHRRSDSKLSPPYRLKIAEQ